MSLPLGLLPPNHLIMTYYGLLPLTPYPLILFYGSHSRLYKGSILPQITQIDADETIPLAEHTGNTELESVFFPAGFLRLLKSGGSACHTLKAFSPMYGNEDKSISQRSLRTRTIPCQRESGREKYFIRLYQRDISAHRR